jgi:hypothetical protein
MGMYGLSADVDLSFFIDVSLIQICLGSHQIAFNFDEDVSITVEGDMGIRIPPAGERVVGDFREVIYDLAMLIERSVIRVASQPGGTLVLSFDNGWLLKIYDSSQHYESYQIRHGSEMFIV